MVIVEKIHGCTSASHYFTIGLGLKVVTSNLVPAWNNQSRIPPGKWGSLRWLLLSTSLTPFPNLMVPSFCDIYGQLFVNIRRAKNPRRSKECRNLLTRRTTDQEQRLRTCFNVRYREVPAPARTSPFEISLGRCLGHCNGMPNIWHS